MTKASLPVRKLMRSGRLFLTTTSVGLHISRTFYAWDVGGAYRGSVPHLAATNRCTADRHRAERRDMDKPKETPAAGTSGDSQLEADQ